MIFALWDLVHYGLWGINSMTISYKNTDFTEFTLRDGWPFASIFTWLQSSNNSNVVAKNKLMPILLKDHETVFSSNCLHVSHILTVLSVMFSPTFCAQLLFHYSGLASGLNVIHAFKPLSLCTCIFKDTILLHNCFQAWFWSFHKETKHIPSSWVVVILSSLSQVVLATLITWLQWLIILIVDVYNTIDCICSNTVRTPPDYVLRHLILFCYMLSYFQQVL